MATEQLSYCPYFRARHTGTRGAESSRGSNASTAGSDICSAAEVTASSK